MAESTQQPTKEKNLSVHAQPTLSGFQCNATELLRSRCSSVHSLALDVSEGRLDEC